MQDREQETRCSGSTGLPGLVNYAYGELSYLHKPTSRETRKFSQEDSMCCYYGKMRGIAQANQQLLYESPLIGSVLTFALYLIYCLGIEFWEHCLLPHQL
ncbi:hypothetical protein BDDG_11690 [Blastomyces dermatitidis ATCC 18188]|uniref:Uncharacterized protein n=1 Tax=Ajellomyces dermatitidis (strain ATCC 18188 / CBS 674.68) TaxID=653446 RepID=A0A0J9EKR5_AJEDA|nr:hypothetical protein BDDG_11690 [Blastomyces dermatitidis ATCC 18188]